MGGGAVWVGAASVGRTCRAGREHATLRVRCERGGGGEGKGGEGGRGVGGGGRGAVWAG